MEQDQNRELSIIKLQYSTLLYDTTWPNFLPNFKVSELAFRNECIISTQDFKKYRVDKN